MFPCDLIFGADVLLMFGIVLVLPIHWLIDSRRDRIAHREEMMKRIADKSRYVVEENPYR